MTDVKVKINFKWKILFIDVFFSYISVLHVYFDYGTMGKLDGIKVSFVDSKTIYFQTPPCQILSSERNITVPIIIAQNDMIIASFDFVYLTRKIILNDRYNKRIICSF